MKELVLYTSADGTVRLDIQLEQETVWLSLNQLAELFGRDKSVISRHLRNIYQEGELDRQATVAKNATVQSEAGRSVVRDIEYYNLDAIISVGYRVNSKRGTEFRIWATNVLKQHIVQGYTANEKRLKELKQTLKVKNHSFVDGNKRIAAAVFLRFADKNGLLRDREGGKRIADNALVAMTLMIAESRPQQKAVITAMLTNLIS
jgi:hypothetical protein